MSATHTPGPWLSQPAAGRHNWLVYAEATGRDVAVIHTADEREMEANARLIAAAPELLATLKETAGLFEQYIHGPDGDGEMVEMAAFADVEMRVRDAIAYAEGSADR